MDQGVVAPKIYLLMACAKRVYDGGAEATLQVRRFGAWGPVGGPRLRVHDTHFRERGLQLKFEALEATPGYENKIESNITFVSCAWRPPWVKDEFVSNPFDPAAPVTCVSIVSGRWLRSGFITLVAGEALDPG